MAASDEPCDGGRCRRWLGHATTVTLAAGGLTVVAVDRNEHALRELPGSVRTEVAGTTNPAAAKSLVDRIAGEAGPLTCW